ncbi:hypothetical protein R1flu_010492 [Riccia fluitans]|uniref:Uncharacterized protein n=1 Tax=Riccia fluitans TaxID=41844 RepID=A0ABD1Z5X4_9MARC
MLVVCSSKVILEPGFSLALHRLRLILDDNQQMVYLSQCFRALKKFIIREDCVSIQGYTLAAPSWTLYEDDLNLKKSVQLELLSGKP